MRHWQVAVAAALGLAAAVVAGYNFYLGNKLTGAASIFLIPLVSLPWLVGFRDSRSMLTLRACVVAWGALSIFAVWSEHRAFSLRHTEAYADAFQAFIDLDQACTPASAPLLALKDRGLAACGSQTNADQGAAIVELQKAKDFGPHLSLADGVRAGVGGPDANRCAVAFRDAKALCPGFMAGSRNSAALLAGEK